MKEKIKDTKEQTADRRQQIIIELLKEFGTGTEEGYVEKIGNSAISKTEEEDLKGFIKLLDGYPKWTVDNEKLLRALNGLIIRERSKTVKAIFEHEKMNRIRVFLRRHGRESNNWLIDIEEEFGWDREKMLDKPDVTT